MGNSHKYFTIAELTRSSAADKLGIKNTPNREEESNLHRLISVVLDPLREAYGKPIRVNSGFRCREVNAAVGGSGTSDHMRGNAADITSLEKNTQRKREENQKIFSLVISLGIPYKQLIDEYGFQWVHISYDPASPKHEIKHIK